MEGEIFGFVGVGKMGTPMSTRLLAAGKKVCVYDRDEQAIAGMVKAGAQRSASAAAVASTAKLTIIGNVRSQRSQVGGGDPVSMKSRWTSPPSMAPAISRNAR